MAGFTAREGCFSIAIQKSPTVKTGFQVQLRYIITQHSIDEELMKGLINFWGCGMVFKRSKENTVDFQIRKFSDLANKVVPFFQRISLQGAKSQDFKDFCRAVDIMKEKGDLTHKGLDQLRQIKACMNTARK